MQGCVWRRQAVYSQALYSDNLPDAIARSQGTGRPHSGTTPRQKALARGIELSFGTPSHRTVTNRTRRTGRETDNTAQSRRERARNQCCRTPWGHFAAWVKIQKSQRLVRSIAVPYQDAPAVTKPTSVCSKVAT